MLPQNPTPRRQSILHEVVVKLEHHLERLARLVVDKVEGEALGQEEDDLQHDCNDDTGTLLRLQVCVDLRV